jgi:hypothetical protein
MTGTAMIPIAIAKAVSNGIIRLPHSYYGSLIQRMKGMEEPVSDGRAGNIDCEGKVRLFIALVS